MDSTVAQDSNKSTTISIFYSSQALLQFSSQHNEGRNVFCPTGQSPGQNQKVPGSHQAYPFLVEGSQAAFDCHPHLHQEEAQARVRQKLAPNFASSQVTSGLEFLSRLLRPSVLVFLGLSNLGLDWKNLTFRLNILPGQGCFSYYGLKL